MSILEQSSRTIDLADAASDMIDAAAAIVTGRLHLDAPSEVRRRLLDGDPLTVSAFRFELARHFAAALLWMDPHILAIYQEHDVPESEETAPAEPALEAPIRLLVNVEVATPALNAAIASLNAALSRAAEGLLPEPPRGYIEAVVIDEPHSRLLQPRARGYRPAPVMLMSREDGSQGN